MLMLQAVLPSVRRRCRERLRTPTLFGVVCMIVSVFAAPPYGLAQYPGVDSDLTAGSITSDDAARPAESSESDASTGDSGTTTATSDSVSASGQPARGTGEDAESGGQADAIPWQSLIADHQRRQSYFIEKLRFEFAVRNIIERHTGRRASQDRVAVYLRDLAAELQADRGIVTSPTIRGIGRDLAVIETMLDAEIDNLLTSLGETPVQQPWYRIAQPPVGSRVAAAQKLGALTQKSELLDFAAKVLAVMPNR